MYIESLLVCVVLPEDLSVRCWNGFLLGKCESRPVGFQELFLATRLISPGIPNSPGTSWNPPFEPSRITPIWADIPSFELLGKKRLACVSIIFATKNLQMRHVAPASMVPASMVDLLLVHRSGENVDDLSLEHQDAVGWVTLGVLCHLSQA